MTTSMMVPTSAAGSETYRMVEPVATSEEVRSSAFSDNWLSLTSAITLHVDAHLRSAAWLDDVLNDLREAVALLPNWNGGGERAVHPSSAKRVVDILNHLQSDIPKPHVVPLSSGALQMEWHSDSSTVEVEVPPQGPALGYAYSHDEETEWTVAGQPNDRAGVAKLAELLASCAAQR